LAGTAVLALVAGVAVLDAQRVREDRGRFAGDGARIDQRPGWRGMLGPAQRQAGRGPGGFGQGGPGRGGRMGGPMFAALDLSAEQRAKVEDIHRGHRDASNPIAEEVATARRTLHRATFADARDEAEIAKLTTTIASLEKQLLELRVKTDLEVAGVLTAEQREKIRAGVGRGRGTR